MSVPPSTGASLTAVTLTVRLYVLLRLFTLPPSFTWKLTVRAPVFGALLELLYETERRSV